MFFSVPQMEQNPSLSLWRQVKVWRRGCWWWLRIWSRLTSPSSTEKKRTPPVSFWIPRLLMALDLLMPERWQSCWSRRVTMSMSYHLSYKSVHTAKPFPSLFNRILDACMGDFITLNLFCILRVPQRVLSGDYNTWQWKVGEGLWSMIWLDIFL